MTSHASPSLDSISATQEDLSSVLRKVAVIIPTYNAAAHWAALQEGLSRQGLTPDRVLIVDSSSRDDTESLARREGYRVLSIPSSEFNHGGTRKRASQEMSHAEILVYMTQDAVLVNDDAIYQLVLPFEDPSIGASFGRQLPRLEAGPIEAHARRFNYPAVSQIRDLSLRETLGFKAIFSSNSFAAYRAKALEGVGSFPSNVIVSEETVVSAKMLLGGWKTAYVAEAMVYHSHDYAHMEEFSRYFDIGVLHTAEPWLLNEFGKVNGEGKRFVLSELAALWPKYIYLLPDSVYRTALKFCGYQLGRIAHKLGSKLARRLSQQKQFWA
jgi:rhamnosyltransferase